MAALFARPAAATMLGVNESPYALDDTHSTDPYLRAWRDLRQRRLASWVTFVAFVPLIATATHLLGDHATAAVTATLVCFVVAYVWTTLFSCPKCDKYFAFHMTSCGFGPLQRDCLHCGIEVGTPMPTGRRHRH
jgi:hypothetical protein